MGVKEALPAVAGDLNNETKFVLDYFKIPYPEKITNCQWQDRRQFHLQGEGPIKKDAGRPTNRRP